jgi:hypothetical protein
MKNIKMNYSGRAALSKKILKECNKNKICEHCNYVNPVIQKVPKMAGKIEVKHSNMYLKFIIKVVSK